MPKKQRTPKKNATYLRICSITYFMLLSSQKNKLMTYMGLFFVNIYFALNRIISFINNDYIIV